MIEYLTPNRDNKYQILDYDYQHDKNNLMTILSAVSLRNGESRSCRMEVYWGASVPFCFLPCLKKRGPGTAEKFTMEFFRILVGEETEKTVHDGICQRQRTKSTSKRFWSYNIYINDITDLPKITDNLDA